MPVDQIALALLGLSFGFAVAGGTFAAIIGIGVLPRFACKSHTAHRILLYEDCAALGAIVGNLIFVYEIQLPVGLVGSGIYGFFSGIFVGCLAVALAEILNVYPIITRKMSIKTGLWWMVLGISFGKTLGSWIQFYKNW